MSKFYRVVDPPTRFSDPIVYQEDLVFDLKGEFFVAFEDMTRNPPRVKVPVVPCTAAFVAYLVQRDELYKARVAGGGYYSEAENPIMEAMDDLWSNLDEGELAFIRAQGSWKFKEPPPAARTDVIHLSHTDVLEAIRGYAVRTYGVSEFAIVYADVRDVRIITNPKENA